MASRLLLDFLLPPFLVALALTLYGAFIEGMGILTFLLMPRLIFLAYILMAIPALIYTITMEFFVSKTKTPLGYISSSALLGLISGSVPVIAYDEIDSILEPSGPLWLGLGLLVGWLTGLVLYRKREK
ncbi:hypothetical protein N9J26_01240 [bacterium]|nr:hypothetical protein [bacterium]